MTKPIRLLLLGGTAEARELGERLVNRPGVAALLSLSGATRSPRLPALPVRIGGFGGAAGQEAFLTENAITHVIDATHPFAARISLRSAALCARLGIAYLNLTRPAWTAGPGDRWRWVADEAEAAAAIPEGATVFLATGRQTLDRFASFPGRRVICRLADPPDAPVPFGFEALVARPPFTPEDEIALFARLKVDWLVAKESGGAAGRAKLDAARHLGLPVAMIRRPPPPDSPRVETVEQALDWLCP